MEAFGGFTGEGFGLKRLLGERICPACGGAGGTEAGGGSR
jgi:hypothetical protein